MFLKNTNFKSLKYLFTISLLVVIINTQSQAFYNKIDSNVQFDNISQEEYPELAYILSIFQDNEGYIWLGTYNGLYKYDGINFESFVFDKNSNSISNSVVHAIAEDKNHNLWFGTEYGLNKYNKKTGIFTVYHNNPDDSTSIKHDHIRSIYIDKNTYIWIGTYGGGLNRFDPKNESFTYITKENTYGKLKSNRINCVLAENDSTFWVGTENGGLLIYTPWNNTIKALNPLSKSDLTISEIFKDSKEQIWVGTWQGGMLQFNKSDSTFTKVLESFTDEWTPKSIKEDIDGNLWIGTFKTGIIIYNPDTKHYNQLKADSKNPFSLTADDIWTIYIDRSQIVWIGTFGGGFGRYDKFRHKFHNLTKIGLSINGTSNHEVRAVCELNHQIWLGGSNGLYLYNKIDNKIEAYFDISNRNPLNSIIADSKENLWLGTDKGLYKFNPTTRKKTLIIDRNIIPALNQDLVTDILEDKHGNIWFAIYDEGLFLIPKSELNKKSIKPEQITRYQYKKGQKGGISSNIIWDIYYVSDNEIWLATNKNIDKFNKEQNHFEGFGDFAHSTFYSNQPGIIWAGSLGQGLKRIEQNTGKTKTYSVEEGLQSQIIYGIQGDDDGNLWISTNKGISKFNPFNESFRNFDKADGLPSIIYSQNSSAELSSGEFIFGCTNGITLFYPNNIKDSPFKTAVKITDIKVLNNSIFKTTILNHFKQSVIKDNLLVLNHKENIVSINFTALSYSATHKIKYAYMLEGFDQDWVYTDASNRFATYTNLDGGDYIFKVKATNADHIWNDDYTTLNLKIKPPFYKTIPFYIFSIFLLGLLIISVYNIKVNTIQQNAQNRFLLEQQEKEKEIMRLNNEKLDNQLEFKKKELASTILNSIKKNEELNKLQEELLLISNDVIPKNKKRIEKLIKEIELSLSESENWAHFEQNFNVIHNDFLKRFGENFTKLTHKDLRICAFIRMNIENKEIARTLNITPESLGVSRTRIRKKIELDKDTYLNDFILRY